MFKLGADTEFLAIKTIKGQDFLFPLEGLIFGDKMEPEYIDGTHQRGVLLDNVCIEYVCKPADNRDEFVNEQLLMKKYIETLLATFRLRLHTETSGVFEAKYLTSENNRTFGCSPAYNPRTLEAYKAPDPNTNLRTASFHLHVSLDKKMTFEEAAKLSLLFDLHVGVPSVVLQRDRTRRQMYGKAGEFRHTVYKGMEYRVLGNEYLFSQEKLELVYEQVTDAIDDYLNNRQLDTNTVLLTESIINNYDTEQAKLAIKKFNLKT